MSIFSNAKNTTYYVHTSMRFSADTVCKAMVLSTHPSPGDVAGQSEHAQ